MARAKGSKVIVHVHPEATGKQETATLKVSVPADVKRVLQIEALGRGCSVGEVVAELVRNVPRRFVLQDRGVKPLRPDVPPEPESPGPLLVRGEAWPSAPVESEVA